MSSALHLCVIGGQPGPFCVWVPPHLHAYIHYTYVMCSRAPPSHRCGCFPFDEGKANLLAGPGNIRAALPATVAAWLNHGASLGEPGNEGTGWRMPSHPPPCPPPPLLLPLVRHQVVLELSPSLGQEVGWSTNANTCINAWTNCICMYGSNGRPRRTRCLIHAQNMSWARVFTDTKAHTHAKKEKEFMGLYLCFCERYWWNMHKHRTHTYSCLSSHPWLELIPAN